MMLGIFSHASWPFVCLLWRTDRGMGLLHCLILGECRGPTVRKTGKGVGKSHHMTHSLASTAVLLVSRGTRARERHRMEDADQSGREEHSLKSPKQVSGLLTLHRDRLELRKAFLELHHQEN